MLQEIPAAIRYHPRFFRFNAPNMINNIPYDRIKGMEGSKDVTITYWLRKSLSESVIIEGEKLKPAGKKRGIVAHTTFIMSITNNRLAPFILSLFPFLER